MSKIFFISLFLIPTFSFADIDVSNCEVIGYQTSHITEKNCITMEKCQQDYEKNKKVASVSDAQKSFDGCVKAIKTPEECAQYIAEQQELTRKECLIYKCPMTEFLLKQKTEVFKTSSGFEKYAYYNNGTPIDVDTMIADNEYAYLFRLAKGFGMMTGISAKSRFGYSIIGPADERGFMFAWIENQ